MESTLKVSKLLKRNFTSRNDTMQDVFDSVNFIMREAKITDGKGKIIFQDNVLFPDFWSDTAVNITASRYFYKGDTYFEKSLKHLVTRIVTRLGKWLYDKYPQLKEIDDKNLENNRKDLYIHIFEAELSYILLHQFAAFNSPVYFNLGIAEAANKKHPETCSACFILGVDDNMPSIKEFGSTEWDIFVSGSGSGANFSKLRGSMENIKSGGGTSSGPLDFIKGFDSIAGRIRSGGRLRRAAIMRILDIDHPDIENFILSKVIEEEKAHALIEGGFDSGIDGDAYRSVALQNGNHSVRVSDEFMQAVQNNNDFDLLYRKTINDTQYSENQGTNIYKTIRAKKLFDQIAEAAWKCGDPGIHFKDNINKWNTIPNSGQIHSSNPCMSEDTSIWILNNDHRYQEVKVSELIGKGTFSVVIPDMYSDDFIVAPTDHRGVFKTGYKAVYEAEFSNGKKQKFTSDHLFMLSDGLYKELQDLTDHDVLYDACPVKAHSEIVVLRDLKYCGKEDVYDIHVPGYNYFVCGADVVVHNCSEVFNIDNTACNLSSINISHFVDGHRTNIKSLEHTAALMFLSQDLMIDNATYPSVKIKNGVKNTRNIGLGITNVGSTLMKLGLPYSSELARLYISSIMALLTAKTYNFSSYVAEDTEPFPYYKDNVKPIAEILEKHKDYIDNILESKLTKEHTKTNYHEDIRTMLTNAKNTFENLYVSIDKGSAQLANCYTTCIAPAGTISLMMDASTTGIEPEYSLIKYKKIANGDVIQIVNNTIKQSLLNLGYTEEDTKTIIKYILDNGGSVVNAPLLRREHYNIFECADSTDKQLIIKPEDHLRMLTDVQKFVGMSISKTINMPNDATVQDIQKIYMMAWELGAKCISIYRDGSKGSQPMSKSKLQSIIQTEQPHRRPLPDERNAITHKFEIGNTKGYIIVGLYEDGSPGELFIVMSNVGTFTSGMIDSFARSVSLGLQYGVPIDKLTEKLIGATFQPNGITSNPDIQMAKSISDYIGRWLYDKFVLSNEKSIDNKIEKPGNVTYTGNVCSICNEPLVRSGTCELCVSCGETTGCS